MSKRMKAGKKGVIAQFITRNAALRRLQLSLAQFRQICIYKGIYPREPKRKPKATHSSSNVFYHAKDILYLSHEPLIQKFRTNKSESKKYHKALSKRDYTKARLLLSKKQPNSLHHIVKERFPSFHDALNDLDDALSMIALFSSLKVIKNKGIKTEVIDECCTLLDHFYYFITRTSALRKVFVSIKGYYFQAEIQGIKILWLVPHQFTQNIPAEVDFKVLGSFLDFYRTLIKFVNYKLFSMENLRMPPQSSMKLRALGYRFLSFTDPISSNNKITDTTDPKAHQNTNFDSFQEKDSSPDLTKIIQPSTIPLFEGLTFLISREVPLFNLALIILNCRGKITWQGDGAPLPTSHPSITHCIVDRPIEYFKPFPGLVCEYIQPQWVFDSFNCQIHLPIEDYRVGKELPPHLSPFVNDSSEGYIPKQREKLDAMIKEKSSTIDIESEEISALGAEKLKDIEKAHYQELIEEIQALNNNSNTVAEESSSANKETTETFASQDFEKTKILSKPESDKQSDVDLRKGLLSTKYRRLYERIENSKIRKEIKSQKLLKKRKAIERQQNN